MTAVEFPLSSLIALASLKNSVSEESRDCDKQSNAGSNQDAAAGSVERAVVVLAAALRPFGFAAGDGGARGCRRIRV